jgi:hypothetical protein
MFRREQRIQEVELRKDFRSRLHKRVTNAKGESSQEEEISSKTSSKLWKAKSIIVHNKLAFGFHAEHCAVEEEGENSELKSPNGQAREGWTAQWQGLDTTGRKLRLNA